MIKLEILEINEYDYKLIDENQKNYILNLEFLNVEENINVGDYIYMNEELLNKKYEGYSSWYTFGSLDSKYGKADIKLDDIDVIKIEKNDKEIYLKRLYG